jgi:hypothetical protein
MSAAAVPLTYIPGGCYLNAYVNKLNHYKDRKLKIVCGSLGINGFFEFGGKNWKKKQFQDKINGNRTDSHCWLEDEEGNVYDNLFLDYNFWVLLRTRKPMKRYGILEGVSKEELARDGVEYVPAPVDAQIALVCAMTPYIKALYSAM